MKQVLFITYYWPPSGKASLHWPLKIIKHLPAFNWQPSVLTVEEDTFSEKDETFIKDISPNLKVYRSAAYEPFGVYKKVTGKKSDEKLIASETISRSDKSFAHRLSLWIRMNLFVPDARIGWYFPAIKKGAELLNQKSIDAIVTVGPPHTSHLIGKKLSAKFNIPHIPVFIDPWVDIAYYKNFKRNKITVSIDKRFEKSVLEKAAAVVFVTQTMKNDYVKKYPSIEDKSNVLYWGYSEEEFSEININKKADDVITIVHAGNIFDYQNPVKFWNEIKKQLNDGKKIKLKFIGTVAPEIKSTIANAGLNDAAEYAGFLPYKKMLSEICSADILLVCATEPRHVPGKLFEYLRAGKPIIAFGDDNREVKNILEETGTGMMFSYSESGGGFFTKYNSFMPKKEVINKFERAEIAEKLSSILDIL